MSLDRRSNVVATLGGTAAPNCVVNVTLLDGHSTVGSASNTMATSTQANISLTIAPLPKLYPFRQRY
jgi:hypothetical protein